MNHSTKYQHNLLWSIHVAEFLRISATWSRILDFIDRNYHKIPRKKICSQHLFVTSITKTVRIKGDPRGLERLMKMLCRLKLLSEGFTRTCALTIMLSCKWLTNINWFLSYIKFCPVCPQNFIARMSFLFCFYKNIRYCKTKKL